MTEPLVLLSTYVLDWVLNSMVGLKIHYLLQQYYNKDCSYTAVLWVW